MGILYKRKNSILGYKIIKGGIFWNTVTKCLPGLLLWLIYDFFSLSALSFQVQPPSLGTWCAFLLHIAIFIFPLSIWMQGLIFLLVFSSFSTFQWGISVATQLWNVADKDASLGIMKSAVWGARETATSGTNGPISCVCNFSSSNPSR